MSSEPRYVGVARPVPAVHPDPPAGTVGAATASPASAPPAASATAAVLATDTPTARPAGENWVARHRRRLRRAILRRFELLAWCSAVVVVAAGIVVFLVHRQSGPVELAGPSLDRPATTGPTGNPNAAAAGTDQAPSSSDGNCAFDPCATPTYAGPPTRIRIAAIRVDSALESLVLDAQHQLEAPRDYGMAGWWRDGVAPGDVGAAIIAGHVDNKFGPAVFYALNTLNAGDVIEVDRGGQTVRFRVTETQQYPKNAFPTARVYAPTPGPELRLITCGGVFDTSHNSYRDNIVVYAILA